MSQSPFDPGSEAAQQWPDDERTVPVLDDADNAPGADPPVDPDLLDAESRAEQPLELTEDELRGDAPPQDG